MWAGTSALRVYAISDRSLPLAALTAILAVVPAAINIIQDINILSYLESFGMSMICDTDVKLPTRTIHETSLIASDVIVLLVTWWQLHGCLISAQRQSRSALALLLLKDIPPVQHRPDHFTNSVRRRI
ncbi:uncharacterized protein B0H18DRAFT_369729 [Fomitopsis serialis]|uniref:uncharacterized protein n=1 Tax=Fomitopsis serialis TaxID=139415 RepID=UPI0020078BA4|nr:uncharacterized protein B0H18DRAFT_369729 [Neoantrodia serialis]KAH9925818.1 hypothetical protein B0H18DRAFT_369729 [Neoantrodia serialis]